MNEKQKRFHAKWLAAWDAMDEIHRWLRYSALPSAQRMDEQITTLKADWGSIYRPSMIGLADGHKESTQDTIEKQGTQMNERQKKLREVFVSVCGAESPSSHDCSSDDIITIYQTAMALLADELEENDE